MNTRGLRRYVDDLLDGRRPRPFDADGFEAAQIRTAIQLRAARTASDAPSEHFLTNLHRRQAARLPRGPETRTRGGCRHCRRSYYRAHHPGRPLARRQALDAAQ